MAQSSGDGLWDVLTEVSWSQHDPEGSSQFLTPLIFLLGRLDKQLSMWS